MGPKIDSATVNSFALNQSEAGQAMVEFVLCAITFLFVILGVMQMALIINAYSLVRYAAYSAVRSGIVHNGNPTDMKDAARMALLPVFPRHGRADHVLGLMENYESAKATDSDPSFNTYNQPITNVEVLHKEDVTCNNIVTFDDPADAERGLLTVKVTHYYEMVVPLANRLLFYVYSFVRSGAGYQGESVDKVASLTDRERRIGNYRDIEYRLPLSATYTMRMQSDFVPAGCN